MTLPVKRSVAVVIRQDSHILTVRRPENDDELPGIWGLPAGSYREGETLTDLVGRIGKEKLGAGLVPLRKLREGSQNRPRYRLEMELWEATMEGSPSRTDWKWSTAEVLEPGRNEGSLCCDLALRILRVQ